MPQHKTERAIELLRRRLRESHRHPIERYWTAFVRPEIRKRKRYPRR
ncbi:hypothetical protein [Roseofilum sp. Belize Diploria]|nr:hypothetical protein [Roseofilum sp. Belize Diploria]MBP0011290.1 hypothetical protein [Roseofilum sp. Belize Diploria]